MGGERSMDTEEAYTELMDYVETVVFFEDIAETLWWDQQIMMPKGGTPGRSKQMSALEGAKHEQLTNDRVGELLDTIDETHLSEEQAANVRETQRMYKKEVDVPQQLSKQLSEEISEAQTAYAAAKQNSDYSEFAPHLDTLMQLTREKAEEIDPGREPYAVAFDEFAPYIELDTAMAVINDLQEALVPFVEEIHDADSLPETGVFEGTYPEEQQHELVQALFNTLADDRDALRERSRLDTAAFPFTAGSQYDTRPTYWTAEDTLFDALQSMSHEFGHAAYNTGLPDEQHGAPVGQHRGLTVHESQARFWENHVFRSKAFWENFLPTVKEHFPEEHGETTPEAAYQSANQVYDDNLIRVAADELTYHMHVLLRTEIERDLVNGDLAVEEVPQAWNEKMDEYLGVVPETDAEGCLQDSHWSNGNIAYFPTYTLGTALAAQLYDAMGEDMDVEATIRSGEYGRIHDWMHDNIHQHGSQYTTDELIEEVTGQELSAQPLINHLHAKYGELYNL